MSTRKTAPRKADGTSRMTPMIGALLRLPHEIVAARMLADAQEAGFDVSATELRVFLWPGPDGRRPAELARQCHMTRQAINYVLSRLEQRGYLVARDGAAGAARAVRVTERGHAVIQRIRATVVEIEHEWSVLLGERRFALLLATLRELSSRLGQLAPAGSG